MITNRKINKFYLSPFVLDISINDINKYWFTSDFHFNHKKILEFTERKTALGLTAQDIEGELAEMKNKIISNFNSVLTDQDILVNCGDIIFNKSSEFEANLLQINCKREYILFGNHDYQNILKKKDLNIVYDPDAKLQYSNLIVFRIWKDNKHYTAFTVSHMPQEDFIGLFNIHGHLHSYEDITERENFEKKNYEIIKKYRDDGRHFDCGLERNNYKPVSLLSILEGKTDIKIVQEWGIIL